MNGGDHDVGDGFVFARGGGESDFYRPVPARAGPYRTLSRATAIRTTVAPMKPRARNAAFPPRPAPRATAIALYCISSPISVAGERHRRRPYLAPRRQLAPHRRAS